MSEQNTQKQGVYYGILAYVMWGLAPLYFKSLTKVPAIEIIQHRIIWSFVLLTLVIIAMKQWGKVRHIIKNPRQLLMLLGTAALLVCNWGIFIWAVTHDRVLEASLGYFINPLLNVLLGGLFLGERLRRWQVIAVVLASVGVLIQLGLVGALPLISLALAVSFGIYGLIRKQMPVDPLSGLLVESAVMLPVAIIYWQLFADSPAVNLYHNGWSLNLLLIGTGLVTTLPLLCFIAGTKRLQYTTMGFLQYIGPSLMFVLAVFVYDETVGGERWVTFGFIWLALMVFSWDSLNHYRRQQGPG